MIVEPNTAGVLLDVWEERQRQETKFPDQHIPNGTGAFKPEADRYRALCDRNAAEGRLTWKDILMEETFEAFAEEDDAALRAELVQVAAVAARWIEDIDSRVTS